MVDELDVVDGLYEAAVLPEFWPQAIEGCGLQAGGIGAVMLMNRGGKLRGFASPGLVERFAKWGAQGGMASNPRLERALARPDMPVVLDRDLFTPDEIETLPYFKTLRSFGVGWSAALAMPMPDGAHVALSLEKPGTEAPFDDAAVDWLYRLRPHVSRAAVTSIRLALERLNATLQAFSALGVAAATIDASGRMIDANAPFAPLLGRVVLDRRDRIALMDRNADALMAQAVARLRRDLWSTTVGSIPIRPTEGQAPLVLHVVPVRRNAHDIFVGAGALLVASEIGDNRTPASAVLQALFDLTPTEAKVARLLCDGRSIHAIALELGSTEFTVRAHLKSAFRKCGVHRQAELVALLRTPFSPPEP
ncbi:helix-turn-helix transcriptional regulator [Xanthobacter autotrophicus DSM 597]|uniref:helix-turn-helix transcriptional regulator n=1 Tax=Xanthobacter TaxID=279 RepID=UPI001AE6DF33|nr:helix-turn-helix transcriptional regulator [Xanthobacter flavus]MBP2150738.1 DNA-binding CsgD family transcriptional regulator [Xanthobacter flavus]